MDTDSAKNGATESVKRPSDYVREFCNRTTLHGIRYLTEKHLLRKLVWFVALGVAIGFCACKIHETLKAYDEKPFSTKVTRHRESEMAFPAVTICNLNLINANRYVENMLKIYINESERDKSFLEMYYMEHIRLIIRVLSRNINTEGKKEAIRKLIVYMPELSQRGLMMEYFFKELTHTIEGMLSLDFLRPCTWRGNKCSSKNFTSLLNILMGQCFTFNSGKQGQDVLTSSFSGPFHGLRLTLNVEDSGHVTNYYSLPAGFKVLIHDQNDYPSIEDSGFYLQPGTHTFAAVRLKEYKNLPKPYKTMCDSPDKPLNIYFSYSYSVNVCIRQCLLEFIVKKCKCQPLFNITSGVELCSIKDLSECIYPIIFSDVPREVTKCSHNCPEPCCYRKYETKLSYAYAVTNSFSRGPHPSDIISTEASREFFNKSEKERQEFIRSNVASLDVYFEELGYDLIEQVPVFQDDWELLANIGGTLGLFVGCGLLTFLEFLDFLVMWLVGTLRDSGIFQLHPSSDNRLSSSVRKTRAEYRETNHSIALEPEKQEI